MSRHITVIIIGALTFTAVWTCCSPQMASAQVMPGAQMRATCAMVHSGTNESHQPAALAAESSHVQAPIPNMANPGLMAIDPTALTMSTYAGSVTQDRVERESVLKQRRRAELLMAHPREPSGTAVVG